MEIEISIKDEINNSHNLKIENNFELAQNKEKAKETAKQYKDLFGDDYYLELQDHNLEEQKRTNLYIA